MSELWNPGASFPVAEDRNTSAAFSDRIRYPITYKGATRTSRPDSPLILIEPFETALSILDMDGDIFELQQQRVADALEEMQTGGEWTDSERSGSQHPGALKRAVNGHLDVLSR